MKNLYITTSGFPTNSIQFTQTPKWQYLGIPNYSSVHDTNLICVRSKNDFKEITHLCKHDSSCLKQIGHFSRHCHHCKDCTITVPGHAQNIQLQDLSHINTVDNLMTAEVTEESRQKIRLNRGKPTEGERQAFSKRCPPFDLNESSDTRSPQYIWTASVINNSHCKKQSAVPNTASLEMDTNNDSLTAS